MYRISMCAVRSPSAAGRRLPRRIESLVFARWGRKHDFVPEYPVEVILTVSPVPRCVCFCLIFIYNSIFLFLFARICLAAQYFGLCACQMLSMLFSLIPTAMLQGVTWLLYSHTFKFQMFWYLTFFLHSTVRDIPDMSELFNVLIFQMATIYISQPLSNT